MHYTEAEYVVTLLWAYGPNHIVTFVFMNKVGMSDMAVVLIRFMSSAHRERIS